MALTPRLRAQTISIVPQIPVVPPRVRVIDYVLLGRTPYLSRGFQPTEEDIGLALEVMEDLDLQGVAGRFVTEMSGGERQRVIIARALIQRPKLLLLDEPTSDLDLKNQIEIMKSLRKLISDPESPKSALIAIHDINIAARFSDRILLLHDGKIISQGTPEEVLHPYNIAKVFGVTSKVEVYSPSVRVIIEDEISDDNSETEESRGKFNHGKSGKSKSRKIEQ